MFVAFARPDPSVISDSNYTTYGFTSTRPLSAVLPSHLSLSSPLCASQHHHAAADRRYLKPRRRRSSSSSSSSS